MSRFNGKKILVVEDEFMIAIDIEASLEELGANVACAGTLERALEAVESDRFDGVVLDLNLAGKEVYPVADILARQGIPFFFHTGHGVKSVLRNRYPDAVVCQKPCLSHELVDALASVMMKTADA
ncbi:response regulator [Consotaella salsifontis]|nr:response regulator [Consotaella salsifontis]